MPHLASHNDCTGCTACVSSCPIKCIIMKTDKEGFLQPVVNSQYCVDCKICEKSCPVIHSMALNEYKTKAYAAYSLNTKLRECSSSGGIFSELAYAILDMGGVVYGAAYSEDFSVKHICIDSKNHISKLQGAKYVQSELGDCFSEILKKLQKKQIVLFSGTPCQVAGLKQFLNKPYESLFCVDFICHSVPSPMAWMEYVKYRAKIDNNGKNPIWINLRSKHTGWSRFQYSNIYKYSDDKKYVSINSKDLFMKLFVSNSISRLSCEHCHFKGYNRVSDITLGDFWGIWDVAPEMDDNKGTSAVLIHTDKGKKLMNRILKEIKILPVKLDQVSEKNPSILYSSILNNNRSEVFDYIRADKMEKIVDLLHTNSTEKKSFINLIKIKARNIFHR